MITSAETKDLLAQASNSAVSKSPTSILYSYLWKMWFLKIIYRIFSLVKCILLVLLFCFVFVLLVWFCSITWSWKSKSKTMKKKKKRIIHLRIIAFIFLHLPSTFSLWNFQAGCSFYALPNLLLSPCQLLALQCFLVGNFTAQLHQLCRETPPSIYFGEKASC